MCSRRPTDATAKTPSDPATTTATTHGATNVPDAARRCAHGTERLHAPAANGPVPSHAGKTNGSTSTAAATTSGRFITCIPVYNV